MYYSVYPKLRAIYSYLPGKEELQGLKKSKGLSGFKDRMKNLNLLKRFPLTGNNLDRYFKMLPFNLSKVISGRFSGTSKKFFNDYLKIYELKDIKTALHGKGGSFYLFKNKENYTLSEIGECLKETVWEEAWNKGYSRFEDTNNLFDIEMNLDKTYYKHLIESAENLSFSERSQMQEFMKTWVSFINKAWIYRLKNYYNLETFEIKRILIPYGELYENISKEEGITEEKLKKELYTICYKDFKEKMFSMRAIIAFFILLRIKVKLIYSIYNIKLFGIEEQRINKLLGEF